MELERTSSKSWGGLDEVQNKLIKNQKMKSMKKNIRSYESHSVAKSIL